MIDELNKLLDLLSLESIFGFMVATLPGGYPNPDNPLASQIPKKFNDMEILSALLPKAIITECMASGTAGHMLLSFTLRHQTTKLSLELDRLSTGSEHFASFMKAPIDKNNIPIIGFSSRGLFITRRHSGLCRAFDELDIQTCHKKASPIYCALHKKEAINSPESSGSTQAIMKRFYYNLDNLKTYSETELNELIRSFWQRLGGSLAQKPSLSLSKAIDYLGLKPEDFDKISIKELQRRFFQLCHIHHPDKGGTAAKFQRIKESFEVAKHAKSIS